MLGSDIRTIMLKTKRYYLKLKKKSVQMIFTPSDTLNNKILHYIIYLFTYKKIHTLKGKITSSEKSNKTRI